MKPRVYVAPAPRPSWFHCPYCGAPLKFVGSCTCPSHADLPPLDDTLRLIAALERQRLELVPA